MALQDDRDRIAARNDATRTPMMQAVFGGPTNKKSQLQRQIDAERAARPTASSVAPTRPAVAAPARENPAMRPLKQAAAAAGNAISNTADNIGLYAPQNARDVGVNIRRASAVPLIAAEVATRPVRAGLGAIASGAADVVGGVLSGEQTPQQATDAPVVAGRPGTGAPNAFQNVTAGSSSVSADPRRRARDDQFLAQDFVAGNKADRSNALNINRPMAIPGTKMQYAGQYGDTAVIERPGAQGERSFSDTDGVAGANRAVVRPVAAAGEQLSPAEQFIRNTTMSDGTRAFGGSGSEQLHQARLDALARGDGEAVTRSQMTAAERTNYDRQNAAYDQNPLKAYEIDQVTSAETAKADATAMRNYRQDLLQQAGLGLRQSAAETAAGKATASARNASLTQANNIVKTLFPDEPEAGGILGAILEQAVTSGNSASLNQLAATEAAKLRAAMSRDDFDPASYMAQYIGDSAPGSDFSAMDDIVPNL